MSIVKLTYFKPNGTYYSSGSYIEADPNKPIFAIHNDVQRLIDKKKLPGLIENHSDFHIYAEITEHDHAFPKLFPIGE